MVCFESVDIDNRDLGCVSLSSLGEFSPYMYIGKIRLNFFAAPPHPEVSLNDAKLTQTFLIELLPPLCASGCFH